MTSSIAGSRPQAPQTGMVVGVLAFAGIVVAVMQTLVVPLIPSLPTLLHTSASNTFWVLTATLLAAAAATPVVGRLGDMYGKRRMLLLSLVMLVIGSVVCALSSSLIPIVVGRALQGLAVGVIPLGISIMRDELPLEKLGSAMALMSASLGVGGALGLPAAAVIAQNTNWHVLFWASAGLGVVVAGLVLAVVKESSVRTGGQFDLLGAVGLTAGLICLLLPISKGANWGWGSSTTLGLLAASVVILLLWGWWELRTPEPLVDLRTTARRQVLMTNIASIAIGFGLMGMSLVLPQLLQMPKATGYGLGQSMLVAGLALAPGGLMMMVISPFSARISAKWGPKVSLMTGAIVMAAGYGLGLVLMGAVWQVIVFGCLISAGVGFAFAAMPALIISAVPTSETAAANSLNSLFRAIGTTTSSAVIGVVLANMTTRFGPYALPSHNAFRVAVIIAGGAALLAFLLAVFIPGRRSVAGPSGVPVDGVLVDRSTDPTVAERNGYPPVAVGRHEARPSLTAGVSQGVVLPQAQSTTISGQVRRSGGGPIPGAALTLIDVGGRQVGRGVSGPDGEYQLAAPGPGSYVLIASAGAHQPEAATVLVGSEPAVVDMVLAGTSSLSGAVSSAARGTPIPDALATLADVRGQVVGSERTNAQGRYRFGDLVAGDYTLLVNADFFQPVALAVSVPNTGDGIQDVELIGGARLNGMARAVDGRVVPDARVTLLDHAGNIHGVTTTDDEGTYGFTAVPEGEYTVIASGYPPVTSTVNVGGGQHAEHDVLLGHPDEWDPAPSSTRAPNTDSTVRDDHLRGIPLEQSLPSD